MSDLMTKTLITVALILDLLGCGALLVGALRPDILSGTTALLTGLVAWAASSSVTAGMLFIKMGLHFERLRDGS